jgi:hypothetical protein
MGLTFCNNYSFTPGNGINLAIMWYDPGCQNVGIDPYNTTGWFDLRPGACREVITWDLTTGGRRWYGFYAESYNRAVVWSGNINSWVSDSVFQQCHGVPCTPCRVVGFRLLDASGSPNKTIVLHT